MTLVVRYVPETPYWLLQNEKDADAEKICKGIYKKQLANAIMSKIRDQHVTPFKEKNQLWKTVFGPDSGLRRILLKCCYFFLCLQFTGIGPVRNYSYYFYHKDQHYEVYETTILIQVCGIVGLAAIILAYLFFSKVGLKWTLLLGSLMIPLSLL